MRARWTRFRCVFGRVDVLYVRTEGDDVDAGDVHVEVAALESGVDGAGLPFLLNSSS